VFVYVIGVLELVGGVLRVSGQAHGARARG
jgi:hypothetical protein